MSHLQRALSADQENDHAHYMMAAALSARGRRDEALDHLKRSIALNPGNRTQAREDPDLENIRDHAEFRSLVEGGAADPSERRRTLPPRRR